MAAGLTFNVYGHDVSASKTLKHVESESKSTSSAIGGHFKKLGTVIGGAFAVAGVTSFFKGAFDEATEAQKVGAQTAAVLKSTGGAAHVTAQQIGDLSTAISNKVGIDDEAIQSGENLLLTFKGVRNEVGKGNDIFNQATQAAVDMSAATGKSLNSSVLQLGKALNDPIKGITALTRVGVTFTAGQKEQIKNLVESGNKMAAQKLILRELNSEFKGSAEAQATPAEKAKVAWKNLQEQIGLKLMPVIAKLAGFLTEKVIPAISATVGWIGKNKNWLVPLAAAIGTVVAALKIWRGVQLALNLVMEANPIVLIVTAIAALVAGLVLAYNRSATFREIVKDVGKVIKTVFGGIIDVVKDVIGFVGDHWKLLVDIMLGPLGLILTNITAIWDGIKRVFTGAINAIRDVVMTVIGFIADHWKLFVMGLATVLLGPLGLIVSYVATHFDQVKRIFSVAWGAISSGVTGAINGIRDAIGAALDAISSAWSAMWGGVRDIASGIATLFGDIISAIRTLPGRISNLAGDMLTAGKHLLGSLWSGIRSALSGAGSLAADIGRDIVNAIIDGLNAILPHHLHVGMPWPVPDINVPLIPSIPHIAQGTGFFRGGVALVGENGRELVNMPAGSKVTSHAAAESQMRMGGGGASGGALHIHLDAPVFLTEPQVSRAIGTAVDLAINTYGMRIPGVNA